MVTRTWIASFAPLLIVLPNLSHAAEYVAIPEEVLVLAGERGRGPGRDALGTDPVRAAIAAGKWTPPRAGDKVGEPGRERTWTTAKLKQGTPDSPGASSGYTYIPIPSDDSRVALLEARGHGMVYVNGEPRIGDVYGTGYVRLPVLLNKGTNHFLFAPGRGPVNVKFTKPKAEAEIHLGDVTAPELVAGEPTNALVGVPILNNTATPANDLILETTLAEGKPLIMKMPSLPPLSMRKVAVEIAGPATEKLGPITCSLVLRRGEQTLDKTSMTFNVVAPTSTRKVTFRSGIDGSVQYYGWVPATPDSDKFRSPGLILTLHGAGVEGIGQAACFSPKAGLHVVAPTNRRAFGFDWEDWGRQDAIEVLDLATKKLKTDLMRTYLTGHSMGGHGTWHLGVTYPDRFAAIGPSAGWVSLRSYGGLRRDDKPSAERELVFRASTPSDTLSLSRNLARTGVFILHGDADDNVPVTQARTMRQDLATFHPDFVYYEQPGAGHWWGNACVDWEPMLHYFQRHRLPEPGTARVVDFRTAHPGVSSRCHWLRIEAQKKAFQVSLANLRHDPDKRSFSGTTDNVARLSFDLSHLKQKKGPLTLELDGQEIKNVPWPENGDRLWLTRVGEEWKVTSEPKPGEKGPQRSGPFRDAFRNRMLFVYGTRGTAEENAWALAKARFDAEQFWYRGNGSIDVIPDTAFDPTAEPDRNVVLYGHLEMNAAWKSLLSDSPVQVTREKLSVGQRQETGADLAVLLAFPRPNSAVATVGVVGGTGLHGLRLTDRIPYFASGAAFPDWTVLDGKGVRGAGFFGNDWTLEHGESAWRGGPASSALILSHPR